MEKKYFLLAIVIGAFITYLNVSTDYCSLTSKDEGMLWFLSLASIFIIMIPALLYASGKDEKEKKEYAPKVFGLFFLCCAPIFFSTMQRASVMEGEFWSFSGLVNDKYISTNHALKSIKVGQELFEGIPTQIWEKIEIGSKVEKQSCEGMIKINGQEYNYGG